MEDQDRKYADECGDHGGVSRALGGIGGSSPHYDTRPTLSFMGFVFLETAVTSDTVAPSVRVGVIRSPSPIVSTCWGDG